MAFQRIEIGVQAEQAARAQYDAGVPIAAIARGLGLSPQTTRRRFKEWGLHARRPYVRTATSPLKLAPPARDKTMPPPKPGGLKPAELAMRVQDAVERELVAVERILAALGPAKLDEVGARSRRSRAPCGNSCGYARRA